MDKHSDFVPSLGKGLLAGAGASAALVMARDFIQALEDAKAEKRRRNPHTGPNTIVINIPKQDATEKLSSARDAFSDVSPKDSKTVPLDRPQRDGKGRFTPNWVAKTSLGKQAYSNARFWLGAADRAAKGGAGAAGLGLIYHNDKLRDALAQAPQQVVEHAADITGASLGAVGGYILVKKLHDMLEKKRLEREIAEAQEEYVDLLHKKSEYDILSGIDGDDGIVKASQDGGFNPSERPSDLARGISDVFRAFTTPGQKVQAKSQLGKALAAGANVIADPLAKLTEESTWLGGGVIASGALLALTSAYVTKKILEKKFKDQQQQAKFTPPQTKIMFKTSADHSVEIEPETAIAAMSFIKAAQSWTPPTGNPFSFKWKDLKNTFKKGKELLTPTTSFDDNHYIDFLSDKNNFRNVLDYKNDGKIGDKLWAAGNARTLNGLRGIAGDENRMKALMGAAIKKNPELVQVMNDPKYNQMISGYADKAMNDYFDNSGFGKALNSGWLGRSGIGGGISKFLKFLSSWFMNSTSMGQKLRNNQMIAHLTNAAPGGNTPPAGTTTPPATTTPVAGATDPLPAGDAVTPPPSGQVATDAPQSGEPVMEKPGSAEKDAQTTTLAMKLVNAAIGDDKPKSTLDPELQNLIKRLGEKEVAGKPGIKVVVTGEDDAAREFAKSKRKELTELVQAMNAANIDNQ